MPCSVEARFPARPVGSGRSGQGANGEVEADEADVMGSRGAGRSDKVVGATGVSLGLWEWNSVINKTCTIAVKDQGCISVGQRHDVERPFPYVRVVGTIEGDVHYEPALLLR
jgi:hypothetical protein